MLSPEGVEWIGDGQRCQPDLSERQAFFEASQQWLVDRGQTFEVIGGSWSYRSERVLQRVAQLIND